MHKADDFTRRFDFPVQRLIGPEFRSMWQGGDRKIQQPDDPGWRTPGGKFREQELCTYSEFRSVIHDQWLRIDFVPFVDLYLIQKFADLRWLWICPVSGKAKILSGWVGLPPDARLVAVRVDSVRLKEQGNWRKDDESIRDWNSNESGPPTAKLVQVIESPKSVVATDLIDELFAPEPEPEPEPVYSPGEITEDHPRYLDFSSQIDGTRRLNVKKTIVEIDGDDKVYRKMLAAKDTSDAFDHVGFVAKKGDSSNPLVFTNVMWKHFGGGLDSAKDD